MQPSRYPVEALYYIGRNADVLQFLISVYITRFQKFQFTNFISCSARYTDCLVWCRAVLEGIIRASFLDHQVPCKERPQIGLSVRLEAEWHVS